MPPETPKPSATVILLRDGAGSPEVLLIERHASSSVLPAMTVFPGGAVEPADSTLEDRIERSAAGAAREQLPSTATLEYCVAALRETFEEVGILLARRRGQSELLDSESAQRIQQHRQLSRSSPDGFRKLLELEDLELALDLLAVHGHWITPEAVERRFDTLFFTALAPAEQSAHHDGIESTSHVWLRPEDALEQARRGARRIIFPTACNLDSLCGFADARSALRASRARPVRPITPRIALRDGERIFELPPDSGYRITPGFDRARLPARK